MDFPRRFAALFSVLGAVLTAGLASCSALNAPDDVIPLASDTTTSGGGDGGSAGPGGSGGGGNGGSGGSGLCNGPEDCASGFCVNGECVAMTCVDSIQNGGETDVDCGGLDCAPCALDEDCVVETDCASGICSNGTCAAVDCSDSLKNANETDVDCGGLDCPACTGGQSCISDTDCAQIPCVLGTCELLVTFTSCNKTGDLGPSQVDCDLAYLPGDPLAGQVLVAAGIQEWIVPGTGTYEIEALGAQGGNHDFGPGGLGASMRGQFELTQGQLLRILVGQKGSDGTAFDVGGGGGTFVTLSDNTPLVVAGGGGGAGNCTGFDPAQQAGSSLLGDGNGGTSGGDGNYCGCGGEGSGGGGFFGDGGANGGLSFVNGGIGCSSERLDQCVDSGLGGFGGGGNGGNGGGGGGGYQGGDAGGPLGAAGKGGLSFNNGLNQTNSTGVQSGHGLVIIRSI